MNPHDLFSFTCVSCQKKLLPWQARIRGNHHTGLCHVCHEREVIRQDTLNARARRDVNEALEKALGRA